MAHIFKQPSGSTKGILCFTHKEIKYLFAGHRYFADAPRRLKRILNVQPKHTDLVIEAHRDAFEKIKKKYFVGIHFGWHQENYPTIPGVDFYMAGPSTITFEEPEKVNFIPLDGSSFIPSCFYLDNPKDYHKEWDIIMVSRDVRWKNLDKFMLSIRKLYDQGHKLKVLLVVPSNNDVARDNNPKITYVNLLSDYEKMFSYEERGLFSILKTHNKMPFLGLAQPEIAKFYHLSKVFTLYSETEGGSRVISEALLAGLPVVVKSNLTGGGRDFLNNENARFFDDFETAHTVLLDAVNNWQSINTDTKAVYSETHEDASLERLKDYFSDLFDKNNQVFDGDLLNTDWLSFRINAHWHQGLPWASKDFISPDIVTPEQFSLLLQELEL